MPDERHLGWRGYLPSISGSQGDAACSTKSLDEVQNLHVLRAMAKPCYVLTCYTVVASPTLGEQGGQMTTHTAKSDPPSSNPKEGIKFCSVA